MTDLNPKEVFDISCYIDDDVFNEIYDIKVPDLAKLIKTLLRAEERAQSIFAANGNKKLDRETWLLFADLYSLSSLEYVNLGLGKSILYKQPTKRGTNSSENRHFYATGLMPFIFNLLKEFLEDLQRSQTPKEG